MNQKNQEFEGGERENDPEEMTLEDNTDAQLKAVTMAPIAIDELDCQETSRRLINEEDAVDTV